VRRGAATVELAFVAVIFLLFMFGILEYGRFIFYRQVFFNAAREGARYAVVNTSASTIVTDTQAQVKAYLNGLDSRVPNYNCDVYLSDSTGTSTGSAANATFGQYICVDVSCTFDPVLPSFIFMGKTFTIRCKAMMGSEAN